MLFHRVSLFLFCSYSGRVDDRLTTQWKVREGPDEPDETQDNTALSISYMSRKERG